ncbi:double-strand break repair protein AddB [Faunimonas sp. B44]|uniref:double-strand break repair protein AddB n=1 Tax=Faunimonas sp. B44 TaxID=3461493 RepID=UPI004044C700
MRAPNVATIPPGAPFLATLVDALLEGRLVAGFSAGRDPLALADVTLYLPTRRSARAIRGIFLERLGGAVLLPRIRALGDVDEDDRFFDADGDEPVSDLPPAIPPVERQLALAGLVRGWAGALVRAAAGFDDEPLLVPASAADAARLAAVLGRLIDQVGTEGAGWQALPLDLGPDLTRYWQITLQFLDIVTRAWPEHLAARGMVDPGYRRDRLIRGEADRLLRSGSRGPVIAAGTTGSVPATAELLAVVAQLPNGAVVLPGLDCDLDEASWRLVGEPQGDAAAAGHPQAGLKRLLARLGVERAGVRPLAEAPRPLALRARFVSEALRPAETTPLWVAPEAMGADEKNDALAGVALVEAANEREEALAIAVILRQAASRDGSVAALVTPDRRLARRVAVELRRWDIQVDDSGGVPLAATAPGVFARLVAEVGLGGTRAESLLALLKHPLARFGLTGVQAHQGARALERAVLRGPRLNPGTAALRRALALAEGRRPQHEAAEWAGQQTRAARGLSAADWRAATGLAERVAAALEPLERLAACDGEVPLAALVEAHVAALDAAARGPGGSGADVPEGEAGTVLLDAVAAIRAAAGAGPAIAPAEYPALFGALIEAAVVRRRGGADPRIHIWGALEARLQAVDTIVLGGLNEGTWPSETRLDPLLSRTMRAAMALEPPERRIGLSAHDFAQALGHRTVWITRARREDNQPRVASRWLQRLLAFAGADLAGALCGRGEDVLAWARALDDAGPAVAPSPRPAPRPAVHLRPSRLSVTEIETLIRDPYAIYARHVLGLRPFEPIAKELDAAERGTVVHAILERFVKERPAGPFDGVAEARLGIIADAVFAEYRDYPEVATVWRPRFERIARWFVKTEADRGEIAERIVESSARFDVRDGFVLTGRADRIDRLADGTLAVIDYKTGQPPGIDEVLSLSPQLPLEAILVEAGAFSGVPKAEVARLEYYRLAGHRDGPEICARGMRKARGDKPEVTLRETIATTEARLRELIAAFGSADTPYLSRKIPKLGRQFGGDYDHLARIAEWALESADD